VEHLDTGALPGTHDRGDTLRVGHVTDQERLAAYVEDPDTIEVRGDRVLGQLLGSFAVTP